MSTNRTITHTQSRSREPLHNRLACTMSMQQKCWSYLCSLIKGKDHIALKSTTNNILSSAKPRPLQKILKNLVASSSPHQLPHKENPLINWLSQHPPKPRMNELMVSGNALAKMGYQGKVVQYIPKIISSPKMQSNKGSLAYLENQRGMVIISHPLVIHEASLDCDTYEGAFLETCSLENITKVYMEIFNFFLSTIANYMLNIL